MLIEFIFYALSAISALVVLIQAISDFKLLMNNIKNKKLKEITPVLLSLLVMISSVFIYIDYKNDKQKVGLYNLKIYNNYKSVIINDDMIKAVYKNGDKFWIMSFVTENEYKTYKILDTKYILIPESKSNSLPIEKIKDDKGVESLALKIEWLKDTSIKAYYNWWTCGIAGAVTPSEYIPKAIDLSSKTYKSLKVVIGGDAEAIKSLNVRMEDDNSYNNTVKIPGATNDIPLGDYILFDNNFWHKAIIPLDSFNGKPPHKTTKANMARINQVTFSNRTLSVKGKVFIREISFI